MTMTAMLLALVLSDAALNESKADVYSFAVEPEPEAGKPKREWKPGIESWSYDGKDCPIFFSQEIEGFGTVVIGPRCREDNGLPHAL
jgi:hypothetical protein